MIDATSPKGQIVTAALRLAAERPWPEITMLDIAEAAHTDLATLRQQFPAKSAILGAFTRLIDDAVLVRATRPAAGTSPRDALFEVVMSRFDAMQPYKAGLRSIFLGLGFDPAMARRLCASQAWMLNAAGIPLDGLGGTARVLGLTSVYAAVFRTWLDDDDPGLSRTMAALDRRLRRGEQSLQTLDSVCGTLSRLWPLSTHRGSGTASRSGAASGSGTGAGDPVTPPASAP